MQCRGTLRGPLRDIIKAAGTRSASTRPRSDLTTSSTLPRCRCQFPTVTTCLQPISSFGTHHGTGQFYATAGQRVPALPAAEEVDPQELEKEVTRNSCASIALFESELERSRDCGVIEPTTDTLRAGVEVRKIASSRTTDEISVDPKEWEPPNHYLSRVRRDGKFKVRKVWSQVQRHQERHNYPNVKDTRNVLRLLNDNTPAGTDFYRKSFETVALPQGVEASFVGNSGITILEIMQRTGSHVQAVVKQTGSFSEVVLYGTRDENSMAIDILPQLVHVSSVDDLNASQNLADYVLRRETRRSSDGDLFTALSDYDANSLDVFSHGEDLNTTPDATMSQLSSTPVRSAWHINSRRRHESDKPIELPPTSFSATDLTAYISDLVSTAPRLVRRKAQALQDTGNGGVSHLDQVTNALVALLTEPSVIKVATSEAINHAFQFLAKHTRYPAVRKIIAAFVSNGSRLSAFNYDILLSAAATAADLHNFRHILKSMIKTGCRPTPMTWAHFHNLVTRLDPIKAKAVIKVMRSKGIFANNQALAKVIHDTIGRDLAAIIQNGGTIQNFYQLYNRRIGSYYQRSDFNWLSRDVMNKISDTLFKAGRNQEAYDVLAEFRRRGHRAAIDVGTLSIFLAPAFKAQDVKLAVSILRLFDVGLPGAVIPNQAIYDMLFTVARRSASLNVLRVIWRYACAAGHVSHRMKAWTMSSLLQVWPHKLALSSLTRFLGGKFALGVSGQQHNANSSIHGENKTEAVVAVQFSPTRTMEDERDSQVATGAGSVSTTAAILQHAHEPQDRHAKLRHLIDLDLLEAGRSKPTRPLPDMLTEAYQVDLAWRSAGIGMPTGLNQASAREVLKYMMRHGVNVPMQAGDSTSLMRTYELPWVLEKYKRDHGLDGPTNKAAEQLKSEDVDRAYHAV